MTRDVILVIAVALAYRLPALATDFWFDEILSYERLARRARSFGDLLFESALKHDNNHHLNTAWLYLAGEQQNWLVYRLPSLLAGLVAVGTIVMIGRRRSRADGLVAGWLVAASYMMVVYSTEARGYAWLLAFAAVGLFALDRTLADGHRGARWIFWLSVVGGLAAHPAILHAYLGALLWSGFRLRSRPAAFVRLHAVPALWTAGWILFVVRGSAVGGGPPWTWNEILDGGLGWTFGYPIHVVPPAAVAAAIVALVLWDAWRLWSEGSDAGLFFVGSVLGPVVLMIALSPPFLFPRYFLVSLFFLLIVAGRRLAAAVHDWPRGGRLLAGAFLVLFSIGNANHVVTMYRERHGNHAAAVQMIGQSATAGHVLVSGWSLDQWTALPVAFYAARMGLRDRIEYIPRTDLARHLGANDPRVDWAVEVTPPCGRPPTASRALPANGPTYLLRKSFPVCGPSGMSWYLYSRSGP